MLAFDIETEGLNRFSDRITVACVYDPEKNIKEGFNLIAGDDPERSAAEFLRHLDEADSLCAFNGARFDLPFIIQRYNVPKQRYEPWFRKLFDYFEVCKILLGSSCSLNKLLEANGEQVKTSSGMQAVVWAKEGNWADLIDYCMSDTVLTHRISTRLGGAGVLIPLTGKPHVVCVHSVCGETGRHSLAFSPAPPPSPLEKTASEGNT